MGVASHLSTPANSVHMKDVPCGIAADAMPLKQPQTRMLNSQQCRLRGENREEQPSRSLSAVAVYIKTNTYPST